MALQSSVKVCYSTKYTARRAQARLDSTSSDLQDTLADRYEISAGYDSCKPARKQIMVLDHDPRKAGLEFQPSLRMSEERIVACKPLHATPAELRTCLWGVGVRFIMPRRGPALWPGVAAFPKMHHSRSVDAPISDSPQQAFHFLSGQNPCCVARVCARDDMFG